MMWLYRTFNTTIERTHIYIAFIVLLYSLCTAAILKFGCVDHSGSVIIIIPFTAKYNFAFRSGPYSIVVVCVSGSWSIIIGLA